MVEHCKTVPNSFLTIGKNNKTHLQFSKPVKIGFYSWKKELIENLSVVFLGIRETKSEDITNKAEVVEATPRHDTVNNGLNVWTITVDTRERKGHNLFVKLDHGNQLV